MIKTLRNLFRADKEKFTVSKCVQDVIPVTAIYEDGIFALGGRFAKTFRFSDINYAITSKENQESIFL